VRCFWTTSVAFEKEFSLKAKAYLSKRLLDSIALLNLRKKYHIYKWKTKFNRILRCLFGGRRKVQVTKFAFEDFIFVFFMVKSLSSSETQPSKFLKGLRYMILSITVKEIRFEMGI